MSTDVDMNKNSLSEQIEFKTVRRRLKTLLGYLESADYAIDSITKSNEIINDHIFIYNRLRKKFNSKYGVPNKKYRYNFQILFFKVVLKSFKLDNYYCHLKCFEKFISVFN